MQHIKNSRLSKLFYIGVCLVPLTFLSGCHVNGHYAGKKDISGYKEIMDSRQHITRENALESMAMYERLYARNSGEEDIAIKYAEALRKSGHAGQAKIILSPLVNIEMSNNAPILLEYAAANIEQGDFIEAKKAIDRILVLDDSKSKSYYPKAYHLQGVILSASGKYVAAEEQYNKALEEWTGDPSPVMNNLALCLAGQGHFDKAIDTLRQAMALSSSPSMVEKNILFVEALQVKMKSKTSK